ncbi:hypothetical protein [Streptomyces sp. NPDC058572]|uniref:hypothetical protein n=1 Tax=Streptomyces sp. NPDC058572 TaxID=3346546 RepID=UPI00364B0B8A
MPRIPRRVAWPAGALLFVATLAVVTYSLDALDGDKANVVIAGAALITAVASWLATARASETAEAMRKIERDRWKHEFKPILTFATIPLPAPALDKTMLRFKYDGPAMHKTVTVRLTIVNDGRFRKPGVTQGLTQRQIDDHIWGPYRFELGMEGASADGKSVPPITLSVGDQRGFWLQRNGPPAEGTQDVTDWMEHYLDAPLYLWVEIATDDETWAERRKVPQVGP